MATDTATSNTSGILRRGTFHLLHRRTAPPPGLPGRSRRTRTPREETQQFLCARSAHRRCRPTGPAHQQARLPRNAAGPLPEGMKGPEHRVPRSAGCGSRTPTPIPIPITVPVPDPISIPIPSPAHAPWRGSLLPAPRCSSLSVPGGRAAGAAAVPRLFGG